MQVFYAPGISGDRFILDENESKHIIKVLRMKAGTEVKLIDGRGNLYEGIIEDPDQKKCLIRILRTIRNFEKRNYRLHVAISPLKNPDRFEWFIEKSVELGIDEITPIISHNTEKPGIKKERVNNIIISAMKQSLKSELTMLNEPETLRDFIRKEHDGAKLIAHCNAEHGRQTIAELYHAGENVLILIGPEGDFTSEEVSEAMEQGYKGITLGTSRLRTETAGIAACHSIYFINQEKT